MTSSYFDQENLRTRIFCFYGNTNDLFINDLLFPMSMNQALHQELRSRGYRRVVYYTLDGGAFFYDRESQKLWFGETEDDAKDEALFADEPLLILPESQEEPARLSYVVSAEEMLRIAMTFMQEPDIPTAIIFPNATEVLNTFHGTNSGSLLDAFFKCVTGADLKQIGNRNVVLFLFNRSLSQTEHFMRDVASEAARKYLMDPQIATRHCLPPPGAPELRRMLNYLRLRGHHGKRLNIRCQDLGVVSKLLSTRLLKNVNEAERGLQDRQGMTAMSLMETLSVLVRDFIGKDAPLDEAACRALCACGGEKSTMDRLRELTGLDSVKREIEKLLLNLPVADAGGAQSRLSPPAPLREKGRANLHLMFVGNSGTGKSTVAALLGEIFADRGLLPSGHLVSVDVSRLKGDVLGASERITRDYLNRARGGVLLIDEAYELARDDVYSQSILTTLVADMDAHRGEYSLILAGYKGSMEPLLNARGSGQQGLAGRLTVIEIPDYTARELSLIFESMAEKKGFRLSEKLRSMLPDFFSRWYYGVRLSRNWANARDARNLMEQMILNYRMQGGDGHELTPAHIPEKLRQFTSAQAEEDAEQALQAMIGQKALKDEIRRMIRRQAFNVEPMSKAYSFDGNPGTGKTTAAGHIGRLLKKYGVLESGHVVSVRPNDLIAGHIGGTAAQARRYFDQARDGVLFIDEAYSLIPDARYPDDFAGAVVNLIMEYIDKSTCVICAGYADRMDVFWAANPGLARRVKRLTFSPYSSEELFGILKMRLEKGGYEADAGYLEAARANFEKYEAEIGEKYNGGYVSDYFRESEDMLFGRLEKQYGSAEQVPPGKRRRFTAADAPDWFVED